MSAKNTTTEELETSNINTSTVEYQRNTRIVKLRAIRGVGQQPYAVTSHRDYTLSSVKELFADMSMPDTKVTLTGRIKVIRMSGKIAFFVIEDESLPEGFQLILKKDVLPDESFANSFSFEGLKLFLDEGDYVQASGKLEISMRGEPSMMVSSITILTKALRPLPNELDYDNLEERYTNRVVDYKMNTIDEKGLSVRDIVRLKAKYWDIWRDEMKKEGFTSIENPIFEHIPGGAEAKPFITKYNELGQDMFMRISLELPLKKLIAGGFESVYEIGRQFRNESSSPMHLQEYTQIEWYKAYTDFNWAATFTKRVYQRIVLELLGTLTQTDYYENKINWDNWCSQEEADKHGWELESGWPKITFYDAVRHFSNGEIDVEGKSAEELVDLCVGQEITDASVELGMGALLDKLWKKARVNTTNPFFLVLPPVELEPLAKRDEKRPELVQRWQVVAGRAEHGKAFSELNDPLDQIERFEVQQEARDNGNEEAQFMDMEYVRAMELGMPPMSGFGVSERLFSSILSKHIRECSTFPYVKKIEEDNGKIRTMVAHTVLLGDESIPLWSKSNTLVHLGTSMASRVTDLVGVDSTTSKDGTTLVNNIQHAIVNFTTNSDKVMHDYYLKAKNLGYKVSIFTEDMRNSTTDDQVEMSHSKKSYKDIKILGIMTFGKKSDIEQLAEEFGLEKEV